MAVCPVHGYPLGLSDQSITGSMDYLRTCQNPDGGFGELDRESNAATSTWVIMTIVAAGENPADWKVDGTSSLDYLKTLVPETVELDGTSETAKMVLTLVSVGEDPRNYEGVDFVEMLKSKEKESGQCGDHIYTTNWAILALSAAGEDTSKPVEWLESQQNADGGFAWALGAESDNDDTASALMALCSAGRTSADSSVKKALEYFRKNQMDNGGFNYGGSSSANSASDSWVIQAIVAAGENPEDFVKNGKNPVDDLLSYQTADGYFMWTSLLTDNPCRMTASAVPALLGIPYPVYPDDYKSVPVSSSGYSTPGETASSTPVGTVSSSSTDSSGERVVTVIDDFGKEVEIHGYPQRIISLAPSNTEILYALGLGDRIVGITDYCNYPAETANVEKIGGYSSPNLEKIVAAKPDLIVASFGNTEEVSDKLRDMGFTVISTNPIDISDVLYDITMIGEATGTESEAQELVSELSGQIDEIRSKASTLTEHPNVVHMVWYDPIWVSGKNTFQNEMFEIIGANNAFPEIDGWGTVGLEDFVTTNPDVIIVSSGSGMGEEGKDIIYNYIMEEPRFRNLNAVKNDRVYVVDADLIDRGGPRIGQALQEVAAVVYPDTFSSEEGGDESSSQSTPLGLSAIVSVIAGLSIVFLGKKREA